MGMLGSASVAGFILPYADFDQLAHAVVNRQRDTGRQSDIQQSEYDNQKPFHSFCKYSKCLVDRKAKKTINMFKILIFRVCYEGKVNV